MAIASSKQQRGKLAKDPEPTITLTLTIPPHGGVESDDAADEDGSEIQPQKATLGLNLWGFEIHQKAADRRRGIVQAVRVAPERSIGDDLKASRWTPFGQLMKAVLEVSPEYQRLLDLLADINATIQDVFADQKASLLGEARVVSYVDDISFQLTRENDPSELLRYLEIFVTENGRQTNLSNLGTGTQSAVIIGMLELVLRAKSSYVKVFAVEEPDAFIHPHGVRHLADLIERIGVDQGTQVVLTTHSPALISTLAPRDIVRVEKRDGHTAVFQSPGTLSDPVFARYVNPDTAEMFFAQRVILVEGDTERFLLPPLSSMMAHGTTSLDFDRRKTSVISMHTKDNVVNFLRILDEFEIEARAILDNDFIGSQTCTTLVGYLRSTGRSIDDSDDTELRKSLWSHGILVLKNGEIENYIASSDVAAVSGRTLDEVAAELAANPKASSAFKRLFRTRSKPEYARQLAEHYLAQHTVPDLLAKIIRRISS